MSGDRDVVAALVCGGIVLVTEPVVIPLLRRLAVIDVPGIRSSHTRPTPRGGGAPIALGLLAAAALVWVAGDILFLFAVAFFGAVGLLDDLRELPALGRLVCQAAGSVVVAALLVAGLPLPAPALVAAAMLIALWVTGFVNAFNFMDGVNGISAAHAVIGGVAFACVGEWRSDGFLVAAGLAIALGACAFLPWNAGRARVFLGDVGSYTLGAALAVLAAWSAVHDIPIEAAIGPLALYLADTAWTLQRRIRRGERPFEAHRTHIYQRWCDVGWSHQEVTLLTAAGTVLLSLLGAVSLLGRPGLRVAADLAGLAVLGVYLSSPVLFWRASRARGRHVRPRSLIGSF
jgi:UDP-N-acetylmuramyl pentapeptide phosphotransferase/UDP-N-acetylglucosamine-1-phosphate transferase